jgi:hypothetical protein
MKISGALDVYILFIIFIKLLFGVSTLGHYYLTKVSKTLHPDLDAKFVFWRERAEFIFTVSVALILIMAFNPFSKRPIELTFEIKLLCFILGVILITGADWGMFIKETPFLSLTKKEETKK